jgi:hypothetical protein
MSREDTQRINFMVEDRAGNKNILSIIQGGMSYGRGGRTVEVAYYTINMGSDDLPRFPDVISFVDLVELENIVRDVLSLATPDEIEEKYVKNFPYRNVKNFDERRK